MGKQTKKEEEKGLVDQATEFAVKPVNIPVINISLEMWQIVLLVFAAYMVWKHQGIESAAKESADLAAGIPGTVIDTAKQGINAVLDAASNLASGMKKTIETATTPTK